MFGTKKRTGNFETLNVSGSGAIGENLNVTGTVTAADFAGGTFTSTELELQNGSPSAPSLSFLSDSTTGIYSYGAGSLAVTVGTNPAMTFTNSSISSLLPLNVGSRAVACGNMNTSGTISSADGVVSGPSIAFTSAPTTGIYKTSTGGIGFSIGGTNCVDIESNQFGGSVPLSCPSVSTGTLSCGTITSSAITCTSVNSSGSIASGNITASGSISAGSNSISGGSLTLPGSYTKHSGATLGTTTSTTALAFGSLVESNGSNITYAQSAANGDTWTINTRGIYALSTALAISNGNSYSMLFWSKNATTTTRETSITAAQLLALGSNYYAYQTGCTGIAHLASGDVVRLHVTNGTIYNGTPSICSLTLLYATTT
jgi:hypothetical protein